MSNVLEIQYPVLEENVVYCSGKPIRLQNFIYFFLGIYEPQ